MPESIEHEERRQAQFDKMCDLFPHCCACGRSIYPHDTYGTVGDEFVFCELCWAPEEHQTANLEVS